MTCKLSSILAPLLLLSLTTLACTSAFGREPINEGKSWKQQKEEDKKAEEARREYERQKAKTEDRRLRSMAEEGYSTRYGECLEDHPYMEPLEGFYRLQGYSCEEVSGIEYDGRLRIEIPDALPGPYALTARYIGARDPFNYPPFSIRFSGGGANEADLEAEWERREGPGDWSTRRNRYCLFRDNLVTKLEPRTLAAARSRNPEKPVSISDIGIEIDLSINPLHQSVHECWDSGSSQYWNVSPFQTFQRLVVWIEKRAVIGDCETLALRIRSNKEIQDVSGTAIDLLVETIRSSDHSLSQVIASYFEESEAVLANTLQVLDEKLDLLGIEGEFLVEALKGISLLKSSSCLATWTPEAVQENPSGFESAVQSCVSTGSLETIQRTLLEQLVTHLQASNRESDLQLATLDGRLGFLVSKKSDSDLDGLRYEETARKVLSFLRDHNQEAFDACHQLLPEIRSEDIP